MKLGALHSAFWCWLLPVLFVAVANAPASYASEPYLVKDIPAPPDPSAWASPADLTPVGDTLFFNASSGYQYDHVLWQTDGTESGTQRLKANEAAGGGLLTLQGGATVLGGLVLFLDGTNLWRNDGPQAGAARLTSFVAEVGNPTHGLVAAGNHAFFWRSRPDQHWDLWVSDGFSTGTHQVIQSALTSGAFSMKQATLGNLLIFVNRDTTHGLELWKSDGTTLGTQLLKDFVPGSEGASPFSLITVGGAVYGFATMGDGQVVLWRTDGSTSGTVIVKPVTPTVSEFGGVPCVAQGSTLYFSAQDATHGAELWKSDGSSTGTQMVKDICPGTTGSTPVGLVSTANGVFFQANDGVHGSEMWRSDGSAAGTWLIRDESPGATSTVIESAWAFGAGLAWTVGGPVGSSQNATSLWLSDGTSAGTHLLITYLSRYHFAVAGERMFFDRFEDDDYELWVSDGTLVGTHLLRQIGVYTLGSCPSLLTEMDGALFFKATSSEGGTQLWRSDGTAAGTVPIRALDFTALQRFRLPLGGGTTAASRLIFTANDGTHGGEPWISDGTTSGTFMLADIQSGALGSSSVNFVQAGKHLFFDATRADCGRELWGTDGTTEGTRLLKDLQPGASSSTFTERVAIGDALYFVSPLNAETSLIGRSDGSAAGTGYLPSGAGAAYTHPRLLAGLGTQLLFLAENSSASLALWKVDTAMTSVPRQVVQLAQPGNRKLSSRAIVAGGNYYFGLNDGVHGMQLWRSDGTAGGTAFLNGINSTTASVYLEPLLARRERLIFSSAIADEFNVWSTDGTAGGTYKLLPPGMIPPLDAWADANRFYCAIYSYDDGPQLWCGDGGVNGAFCLGYYSEQRPASAYGWVYFAGADEESGTELWQARDSSGAMRRVGDITPGPDGTFLDNLTIVGSRLFFSAMPMNSDLGWQLWAVDLTSAASPGAWLCYE